MITQQEFGFSLANGSRLVHGEGASVKDAFSAELNIPGSLIVYNAGNTKDSSTPSFCGPHGALRFTTENRMPRHVHMTMDSSDGGQQYVTEKIFVPDGVGIVDLGGELYVIPPMTLVLIGPGVPHTWTACPPGLDFQELGLSKDQKLVSEGTFTAIYEYSKPTGFFPTAQTETLKEEIDYVKCEDLQSIRIPQVTIEFLMENAWFVWGRTLKKARNI